MKQIELSLHTLILTIGPSGCGKSFFTKNILKPLLEENDNIRVKYLSSDEIRRELLGKNLHKHDPEMLQVSDQAFTKLNHEVKLHMSFPLKYEFIIVDTTGLGSDFRKEMTKLAKEAHYNIMALVFDFTNRDDYYLYNMEDRDFDKIFLAKSIKRFKTTVLPNIKFDGIEKTHKIKSKDFNDYSVKINNLSLYQKCFLNKNEKYLIIGDIHGCYREFMYLLDKNGVKIEDNKIVDNNGYKFVLVGDYIDKGSDILDVIKFIYTNKEHFIIVVGNHENYVYKALCGQILRDKDLEEKYFQTIDILQKSENFVEMRMFIELFDNSLPFVEKTGEFIVTHAPCPIKYVGKLDNYSLKKQRNLVYSRLTDNEEEYYVSLKKDFNFLETDSISNSLPIVCGHVMVKRAKNINNYYLIDGGCVSGGKLVSLNFNKGYVNYDSVNSINDKTNELLDLDQLFSKDLDIGALEPRDRGRLFYSIDDKINFVSGTVSPSNKNMETNELESFDDGLKYFEDCGVKRVVIQPKYMGSRCNVYLHKDYTKSYSTSRNGFKIKKVDLTEEYKKLRYKLDDYFNNGVEMLILDGELLPWRALGDGLIDASFLSVQHSIKNEYDFLIENGFDGHISGFKNKILETDFISDQNTLKKEDLIKKYGQNTYRIFKSYLEHENEFITMNDYKNGMDTYEDQLNIFAAHGDVHIKCFNILKVVKEDGTEEILLNNETNFNKVSDDRYCVVDFENKICEFIEFGIIVKTSTDIYGEAKNFYKMVTEDEKMEGVVIKPSVFTLPIKHAPFIKVRNPNYLHIIYGFDYKKPHKYKKLINKKYTKTKLSQSIREFNLGYKLLNIKYNDINKENKDYINTLAKIIFEEKRTQILDPRL